MVIAGIVVKSLAPEIQGHLWMQIGLLLIFAVIGVLVPVAPVSSQRQRLGCKERETTFIVIFFPYPG